MDVAERRYLDIIKFFHECGNSRFFDSRAMDYAATNGHFDIVQFLHENRGEDCAIYTLGSAYTNGHPHVVDYLCEHRPALNAEHLGEFMRRRGSQTWQRRSSMARLLRLLQVGGCISIGECVWLKGERNGSLSHIVSRSTSLSPTTQYRYRSGTT